MTFFKCAVLFSLLFCITTAAADEWQTKYEKSNFLETSRYPETVEFCKKLANASGKITYTSFGISPQGRELPLLIVDRNGNTTPVVVKKSGNAIVLIMNGIHAGEIDGKDASLMFVRDMVIHKKNDHLLNNVTYLFIPIFNVDGHEMFGKHTRINQNGPVEKGFRGTVHNYNLNRDFLKLDAPEMRSFINLFNKWLPDLLIDNHVTDGADHQYVLTYGVETMENVSPALRKWTTDVFVLEIERKMLADNMPIRRYFSMQKRPEIKNGARVWSFSPRYSTGFGAVQNRLFLLVENHALKDYKTRVTGNYHLFTHIFEEVNKNSKQLININLAADKYSSAELVGKHLPLAYSTSETDTSYQDFLGIDYTIEQSEISNAPWVKYNGRKKTFRVPFFETQVAADSALVPSAYLIPPQWQTQIQILQLHGVKMMYLQNDETLEIQSYKLTNQTWQPRSFEGRHLLNVDVEEITEKRTFPAGTAVIQMNQRVNRLIIALLEPKAPDSFLRWGFWNTIFEQKEYGEDYILENLAREMLAENPDLKAEFEKALAEDPKMAENKWARLYFFYNRSPYAEKNVGVYPVGKLLENIDLQTTEKPYSKN